MWQATIVASQNKVIDLRRKWTRKRKEFSFLSSVFERSESRIRAAFCWRKLNQRKLSISGAFRSTYFYFIASWSLVLVVYNSFKWKSSKSRMLLSVSAGQYFLFCNGSVAVAFVVSVVNMVIANKGGQRNAMPHVMRRVLFTFSGILLVSMPRIPSQRRKNRKGNSHDEVRTSTTTALVRLVTNFRSLL